MNKLIAFSILAATVCQCACVSRMPPDDTLTVVSFNIHHAAGRDGWVDLERVARVLREARPDVICLQEVDRKTERSEGVDQFAELGRLLGTRSGVFAKSRALTQGETGVAVLSFWDVRHSATWMLPGDREPAVLLAVDLAHPSARRRVRVATTRLDPSSSEVRLRQARSARVHLDAYEQPVQDAPAHTSPMIFAGDFSADAHSTEVQTLLAGWRDTGESARRPTFPAHSPDREWDYILFRPPLRFQFTPRDVLPDSEASTHRPVRVTLEWAGDTDADNKD